MSVRTFLVALVRRMFASKLLSLVLFAALLFMVSWAFTSSSEQTQMATTNTEPEPDKFPRRANIARALTSEKPTTTDSSQPATSNVAAFSEGSQLQSTNIESSGSEIAPVRPFDLDTSAITDPSLPKKTDFVMIKTHKTASTTLASILFRFGVANKVRFLVPHYHYIDFKRPLPEQPESNIALYHHFTPSLKTDDIISWYRVKLPKADFITVVREPISRALSEYYYIYQPESPSTSLYSWLSNATHPLKNRLHHMSSDLGVYTESDMEYFLNDGHKHFKHILILEKFDESLVLMRRMFNWNYQEVLYLRLLDACKDGKRTWDKKSVKCGKTETVSDEAMALVKEAVAFDMKIYELASRRLQALLDAQPPDFWDEVAAFKSKLQELSTKCTQTQGTELFWSRSSLTDESRKCTIFRMNDLQFEKIIKISRGLVNPSLVDVEANNIHRRASATRNTRS